MSSSLAGELLKVAGCGIGGKGGAFMEFGEMGFHGVFVASYGGAEKALEPFL